MWQESQPSRDQLGADTRWALVAEPGEGGMAIQLCVHRSQRMAWPLLPPLALLSTCYACGEHPPLFPQPCFFSKVFLFSTLPHFSSYHNF